MDGKIEHSEKVAIEDYVDGQSLPRTMLWDTLAIHKWTREDYNIGAKAP